jgi:hypothetical protein
MLQPFSVKKIGGYTLENLPYAKSIHESIPNKVVSNKQNHEDGLFGNVEFAPKRKHERIINAFRKRLTKEGLVENDVEPRNIGRHQGHFVAIDPGTFSTYATGGDVRDFRGVSSKQIIQRYTDEATTPKGQAFAPFYDLYREHHPLQGTSRRLFNEIYASQSMGAMDKYVLQHSVNIYKTHKDTGSRDALKYERFLRKLGHNVPNRIKLLQHVFNGKSVTTPKLGSYLKGLEDPGYYPVDRSLSRVSTLPV